MIILSDYKWIYQNSPKKLNKYQIDMMMHNLDIIGHLNSMKQPSKLPISMAVKKPAEKNRTHKKLIL